MARSTAVVLATGAMTLANEAIFAPMAGQTVTVNWRIVPATAALAVALGALEHLAPEFAVGLAWLALVSALFIPVGNAPTPIDNLSKILGYTTK